MNVDEAGRFFERCARARSIPQATSFADLLCEPADRRSVQHQTHSFTGAGEVDVL